MSQTFPSPCCPRFRYTIVESLVFYELTANSKFCSRLYQCLLFASRYPIPFVVNVPPRVGRPAVLRPQDLETRYWIPAPYSGFCRSVRDIAATTFTTDHVSFGNKAEPLDVTYTVFYLDQVNR